MHFRQVESLVPHSTHFVEPGAWRERPCRNAISVRDIPAVITLPCLGAPFGVTCIPRIFVLRKLAHVLSENFPNQRRAVVSRDSPRRTQHTSTWNTKGIGTRIHARAGRSIHRIGRRGQDTRQAKTCLRSEQKRRNFPLTGCAACCILFLPLCAPTRPRLMRGLFFSATVQT